MFKFNKTPFAQVFFHDIKNKLGSIKFSISMLKNPKLTESQRTKLIESLHITVEKTIDMLQDFIEMERFKKAGFLKNENINLAELLKEITEELDTEIERKNLNLYINANEDIFIKANREWLKKAVFNIIHNSVKYNKQNGDLFISVEKEKNGYLLTIRDTGIGMSKEEKNNVFKKYYTSGKEHGTGIGLSMSKAVIESFGGAIAIESEKDAGTEFFIYLPKTAKQIKIKRLAAALSAVTLFLFVTVDYYYCLIPQKTITQKSKNTIIYKLENGVTARTEINDKVEIVAFKNILNTRSRTKFIVKNADIYINTASKPIEVITLNGEVIKNRGTEFETVSDNKTFATSVYKGQIQAGKTKIGQNEGLIKKRNRLIKENLPEKVANVNITTGKNHNINFTWESKYKNFIITISRDKNFADIPLAKYQTSKKHIVFNTLDDGKWYAALQAEKDSLFSLPVIKTFLSLRNYQKALNAFKQNDLTLANTFINISLSTIKNDSYKPYLLKSKILLKQKQIQDALKFAQKAYEIDKNDETKYQLGLLLYKINKHKKSIKILKTVKNKDISELLAYIYFKLGDYKKAKKYLYKTLEKNPKNIQALKMMIEIQKKENNTFLIQYFKRQLRKVNGSK